MNRWLCRPWGIALLVAGLVGLDQWTKALAVAYLKEDGPVSLWDGVFELRYLENRGAAFGLFQGQQTYFLLVGILVFAGCLYLFAHMSEDARFWPVRMIAVSILAGAWGNMIDRIRYSYVVDFLYFRLIDFPIFNVADIYVTVGTAVLVLLVLFRYKEEDLNELMKKEKKTVDKT